MDKGVLMGLILGGITRYLLILSRFSYIFGNRVEISTPYNSFKRAKEGVFLLQNGVNPYDGDIVHEIPLILVFFSLLEGMSPHIISLLYVALDLTTAICLRSLARNVINMKLMEQEAEKKNYASNTEGVWWNFVDKYKIPRLVVLVYLFNPLSILNCVGMATTVLSNFFFAFCLYFLSRKQLFVSLLFLAIETVRNFYPFVLIAPIIIFMNKKTVLSGTIILLKFFSLCCFISCVNYYFTGNKNFMNGILGIFTFENLQPNIGLFWYFFTEMFDHFRAMFLITFQMNATVLYLIPLSLKIHKDPFLLATILIALMSMFRAYPSFGDVAFYLALAPLSRRSWKYMAHNFIVFCFFVITLSMMPVLWHLWIYAGSANANFYFGATLAFSTGQIFLVTDLLFAHVKRNFCLYNGEKIYIDGEEAKIILE